MADLDAGATGTMTSALLPDLIRPIVFDFLEGRRDAARAGYARLLPLINFENRQCGLRATKTVMKAGGVIKSDGSVLPELNEAIQRGVLLDVAQADSHWSFEIARRGVEQGILPHTMSTDLTRNNINGA